MTKYMKSITRTMPEMSRIMHETPPCGIRGARVLALPFAGLNFAINCDGITAPRARMGESSRMKRRDWLWLAPVLCACRKSAPPLDVFPDAVAGAWRRTALRDVPVSEAPDPVPRTSVRRLQAAAYEGPGTLEARVYELTSPGVGLDLVQRWRPSADTVFFYRGRYFAVVKWRQAERQPLQAFIRELEARLPER